MIQFIYFGALAGAGIGAIIAKRLQSKSADDTNGVTLTQKPGQKDDDAEKISSSNRGEHSQRAGGGGDSEPDKPEIDEGKPDDDQ